MNILDEYFNLSLTWQPIGREAIPNDGTGQDKYKFFVAFFAYCNWEETRGSQSVRPSIWQIIGSMSRKIAPQFQKFQYSSFLPSGALVLPQTE